MRLVRLMVAVTLLAQAQTFDVASVKPAAPRGAGRLRISKTVDPGSIAFTNATLMMVLTEAFDIENYRISGPEWLNIDMFDITAKLPPGTTKEQMHIMLQNLIAERFKMVWHREKKETASYTLVVARSGQRLKASEIPDGTPEPAVRQPMTRGSDGFPAIQPGHIGLMEMDSPGKSKLACLQCTMANLTDQLSRVLNQPVIDATGLKGNYTLSLIFEPEYRDAPSLVRAGPMPSADAPPPDENVRPLRVAIQEQLGLRLEPKKSPVEIVVIDRIEKNPTEN